MKYALIVLAIVVLCTASMAATGPFGGWGQFNGVTAMADGVYTATGFVYDPNGGMGIWKLGSENTTDGFTVTADVEMWMSMQFNATDIYFHIGQDLGPAPKVSANIGGWLNSNNGQYLFVSKANPKPLADDLGKLDFKNDMFGRTPTSTPPAIVDPIKVKWFLTDGTGIERPGDYSDQGNGGNLWGITWLLDSGTAGLHVFNIRCEIAPDRYQPDGHYEMDPVLVGSPVL